MTRYVVTGAGGWIGRASLELLRDRLGPEGFARDVVAFGATRRVLTLRPGLSIVQHPLATLGDLPKRDTTVLHTAFLTRERAETMTKADYIAANRAIRAQVLAAQIGTTALFLPSSGAAVASDDAPLAMRLYGALKREDEEAFAGRIATTVIARVFNLSGRHINKPGHYALAAFITEALAGRPIIIRAGKPVLRSYVAVDELLTLALALLGAGESVRFDTAGDETVELGEVARRVARIVADTGIERPPVSGAPDHYVGDRAAYASLLSRNGIGSTGLGAQISVTADWLAQGARLAA